MVWVAIKGGRNEPVLVAPVAPGAFIESGHWLARSKTSLNSSGSLEGNSRRRKKKQVKILPFSLLLRSSIAPIRVSRWSVCFDHFLLVIEKELSIGQISTRFDSCFKDQLILS